jgi:hypothetical protein
LILLGNGLHATNPPFLVHKPITATPPRVKSKTFFPVGGACCSGSRQYTSPGVALYAEMFAFSLKINRRIHSQSCNLQTHRVLQRWRLLLF